MGNRLMNLPALRVFQQTITAGGTAELLSIKKAATTIAFVNNGAYSKDTITDSGNGFLTAGFKPGDKITVSGATNTGNNTLFVIDSVVAGTITLTKGNVLTAESAGATVKIVAPVHVPEGVSITLKAKYGNSGTIYVGHSTASAKSTGFTLRNNESISLQVNNTGLIYIDGTTNEGVEVIVETGLQAGE